MGIAEINKYPLAWKVGEKWLHKFGRCGRWIGCLTAGTVVLANQERR
jgi:hypothetical protein